MNRKRYGWIAGMPLMLLLIDGALASNAVTNDATVPYPAGMTSTAQVDSVSSAYQQMELLTEVLMQVRHHYVEELTYEELLHGAIDGLLRSLDPHSSFMESEAYEDLLDDTAGQYGGIGIHIGLRNGVLTVIAPIEDTPAFRAGLQSGDMIMEIDGESTANMSLRDAVGRMRGPRGEALVLSVVGAGQTDAREVAIIRDIIEVASVKGARLIAEGIGYVRLTQFAEPTASMLQSALDTLADKGMRALVLDLRGNPGGLLSQAVAVAQVFLEEHAVVVSTRGRSDLGKRVTYRAGGAVRYMDLPMVVLVNAGSASASEIVAGAIQDHRRGVLIGETTYGKGSVQSVIRSRTDGESAIRLTTAHYYTPADRLIHKKGLEPDIKVPVSREQWMRVQRRRARVESPALFTDEEPPEVTEAVDEPLRRAVDLLTALLIVNGQDDS